MVQSISRRKGRREAQFRFARLSQHVFTHNSPNGRYEAMAALR